MSLEIALSEIIYFYENLPLFVFPKERDALQIINPSLITVEPNKRCLCQWV
jgi:hypothetical protein